jgi:hypothetical protein
MNKWNKLLKMLDAVFGFESIKNSSVKKLKQYYDEKRDEHVFVVEYRVVKGNNDKQNGKHHSEKFKPGNLIRDINSQVSNKTDNPRKSSA